ncbi:death-associated protein kinase related [Sergentomyia squamirostris]
MIHVDESDPTEELEPSFPHRPIEIHNEKKPSDFYDISTEELGRGKYGTVYLCRERSSNLELAAKFVPCPKREDRRNMEREIDIMRTLQHPRLIQIYDAFDDGHTITIILELILGGELFERVIGDDFELTERACTVFMRQICDGVDFIHSNNIVHLDLKPENILCLTKTGNRIKIIDFGLARHLTPDKKLQVLFGTPEFAAPEVVNFDQIGFFTDMWSVGVICYVLLSGLSPFMGDNDVETMTNVTLGKYDFNDATFDAVSADAKDFITKLLVSASGNRLTAQEALQHPWLRHSAHNIELPATKTKLKRYVIKKRWIKAVYTIIALQRMGAKIDLDLL